jgi:hypothetical protein
MLAGAMPAEWEESSLRVPLGLRAPPIDPGAVAQRAAAAVGAAGQRAGDDGWEPLHAVDFASLERLGQVERRVSRGFLGLGRAMATYVAAAVRLCRLVIDERPPGARGRRA